MSNNSEDRTARAIAKTCQLDVIRHVYATRQQFLVDNNTPAFMLELMARLNEASRIASKKL